MNFTLFLTKLYRFSKRDAFAIISDTSIYFAEVVHVSWNADQIEVIYFFILFIVRFIPFMYYEPAHANCGQQTQQLYHMLLSTFLRWLDSALYNIADFFNQTRSICMPRMLHIKSAIYGLLMQCVQEYIFLSLYSNIYHTIVTRYSRYYFQRHCIG